MGNLIQNERTKLYKKPSTWILTGIIVALTLIGLVFSQLMFSNDYEYDWRDSYKSNLEWCAMTLKDNPDDIDALRQYERTKYLLDNDIAPSDWRTAVAEQYYSLKHPGLSEEGELIQPDAEMQKQMETLKSLLDNNDWRAYIRQQIAALESGDTAAENEQEKKIRLEIYNLYLEMGIVPTSGYSYGNETEDENTWKSRELQSIETNKLSLVRGVNENEVLLTSSQRAGVQQAIDVSLKRLATDTPPVQSQSFLGLLESSASSMEMVTLLLIVLAGGIISTEFSAGTVKLLLITPHRRKKIFWAKAVVLLEITLIAAAAVFVLSFLLCGVFTGFQGIGDMQVMTLFGRVCRFPYLLYIVLRYLVMLLPVLAYGALALMMSAVTRNSGASIAVTLLLMFGSEIVMTLISAYTAYAGGAIPGIKFLFFANTSLGNYLPSAAGGMMTAAFGTTTLLPDGTMTLGFSVVVLLVYTACFLWIARDSFCRRDIK